MKSFIAKHYIRALDRGRIGIFYASKMQKNALEMMQGTSNTFLQKKKIFVKMTPLIRFIHLIMQEYDSKCLKMYLKSIC
jgi:hypothetical protein